MADFKTTLASIGAYLKTNWLILILMAAVMIFLFKDGCKRVEDQVIKRDTTRTIEYVQQPPVYIPNYIPQIVKDSVPKYIIVPPQYQPPANNNYAELLAKYEQIVQKLLKENRYKDTIRLKDSTGANVGSVHVNDLVSENQIKDRAVDYQLKFPKETITITNTVKEPPRTQLYFGGGLSGSQSNLLQQANAGILLKNKKDQILGLGVGVPLSGNRSPMINLSYYQKLSFRK